MSALSGQPKAAPSKIRATSSGRSNDEKWPDAVDRPDEAKFHESSGKQIRGGWYPGFWRRVCAHVFLNFA